MGFWKFSQKWNAKILFLRIRNAEFFVLRLHLEKLSRKKLKTWVNLFFLCFFTHPFGTICSLTLRNMITTFNPASLSWTNNRKQDQTLNTVREKKNFFVPTSTEQIDKCSFNVEWLLTNGKRRKKENLNENVKCS